jgi:hypothetical protein
MIGVSIKPMQLDWAIPPLGQTERAYRFADISWMIFATMGKDVTACALEIHRSGNRTAVRELFFSHKRASKSYDDEYVVAC